MFLVTINSITNMKKYINNSHINTYIINIYLEMYRLTDRSGTFHSEPFFV